MKHSTEFSKLNMMAPIEMLKRAHKLIMIERGQKKVAALFKAKLEVP